MIRAILFQRLTGEPRKAGWAWAALTMAIIAGWAMPADAVIQTLVPQLLPIPTPTPPPTPAPLAPPINPGYAPAETSAPSPILTAPGGYEFPQPPAPRYPAAQLPGPIDQQKLQAYRNGLVSQQWQLQSQGLSPSTTISRQILQQLNAPDAQ
jgi:hypothetical protein